MPAPPPQFLEGASEILGEFFKAPKEKHRYFLTKRIGIRYLTTDQEL